jgi:hypothetical protein
VGEARVSLDRTWVVTGGEGRLDAAIDEVLNRHGLAIQSRGEGALRVSGGSGIKMRLLGGWFVNPRTLPKVGTITRVGADSGQLEVTMHLEESMGFGVLDRKLARRYGEAFEQVASSVEAALSSVADACERSDREHS